jgi:hypothetical protein
MTHKAIRVKEQKLKRFPDKIREEFDHELRQNSYEFSLFHGTKNDNNVVALTR